MNKFFIKSFGCQYNEWDASRLTFILTNLGFIESAQDDAGIVFLLNCSVRKTGVDRAMSFAKNFIKAGKRVFISGCILDHDKKIFKEKGVTVWNVEDIHELIEYLGVKKDKKGLDKILFSSQKSTNLIPIMKGCNNFCSYCAVPYTRGREISRPINEILDDIKKVISVGHKEIWLLGQNVNSYEFGFAELLRLVNDLDGDFLVRFTSNHPKDMSNEIIEAVAKLQKVAKQIHLPVQSGSNKVLRSMNRPYTREDYLAVIKKITRIIPNVNITTDVIIGFPSETEDDFQETVSLLKSIKFSQAYINKYSPREGTAAFKLGDPIPWKEKERRWRILNEIVNIK